MEYMTVVETAARWGVSPRWAHKYVKDGRIQGAARFGSVWMIPVDAEKPGDLRREKNSAQNPLCSKTSSFPIPQECDLSSGLASCLEIAARPLWGHAPDAGMQTASGERQRVIPEMWLAYLRGDFARVKRCFLEIKRDDALKLCMCQVTTSTAISLGDLPFFTEIESWLKNILQAKIHADVTAYVELVLAAPYLYALAPVMAPGWLKEGDFSVLPTQAKPVAAYARIKYFQGLRQYEAMHTAAQTTLTLCAHEQGFTCLDIYLRIANAVACQALERENEADRHMLSAMSIALPYGFITPFAENIVHGGLVDRCLRREFPARHKAVKEQFDHTMPMWIAFHNRFTKRNITLVLSPREYGIAMLAAQRVPYAKIAAQYFVSVGRIKNIMMDIYKKLHISSRDELAKFIV
jgi:DNA-binding CsgD family transcriptional regulator